MIITISTTPPRKRASRKPALAHLARLPKLLRARTTGNAFLWQCYQLSILGTRCRRFAGHGPPHLYKFVVDE